MAKYFSQLFCALNSLLSLSLHVLVVWGKAVSLGPQGLAQERTATDYSNEHVECPPWNHLFCQQLEKSLHGILDMVAYFSLVRQKKLPMTDTRLLNELQLANSKFAETSIHVISILNGGCTACKQRATKGQQVLHELYRTLFDFARNSCDEAMEMCEFLFINPFPFPRDTELELVLYSSLLGQFVGRLVHYGSEEHWCFSKACEIYKRITNHEAWLEQHKNDARGCQSSLSMLTGSGEGNRRIDTPYTRSPTTEICPQSQSTSKEPNTTPS
jgi:hypothetical protein